MPTPLYMIGSTADSFVTAVEARVGGLGIVRIPVSPLDEIKARMLGLAREIAKDGGCRGSLDIISHAFGGIVSVAKWTVAKPIRFDAAQAAALRNAFVCIRLLGCHTIGLGKPAQAAIALHRATGLTVLGTTRTISPLAFAANGFVRAKFASREPLPEGDHEELLLAHDQLSQSGVQEQLLAETYQRTWYERFAEVEVDLRDRQLYTQTWERKARFLGVPFVDVPFTARVPRRVDEYAWPEEYGINCGLAQGGVVRMSVTGGGMLASVSTHHGRLYWNLNRFERDWMSAWRAPLLR